MRLLRESVLVPAWMLLDGVASLATHVGPATPVASETLLVSASLRLTASSDSPEVLMVRLLDMFPRCGADPLPFRKRSTRLSLRLPFQVSAGTVSLEMVWRHSHVFCAMPRHLLSKVVSLPRCLVVAGCWIYVRQFALVTVGLLAVVDLCKDLGCAIVVR